jgi:hypothetical protein
VIEAVAADNAGTFRLVAVEAVVLYDLAYQAFSATPDLWIAATQTDIRYEIISDAFFVVPAFANVHFIIAEPGAHLTETD